MIQVFFFVPRFVRQAGPKQHRHLAVTIGEYYAMIIVVYGPAPAHMNIAAASSALRATVLYAVVLSVAACAAVSALSRDRDAWPAASAGAHAGTATPARQLTDSIDNLAASVAHIGAIASLLQTDTPMLDAAFDAAGQAFDSIAASLAPLAARSAVAAARLAGVADDCAGAIDRALTRSAVAQAAAQLEAQAPPNAAAAHSAAASSRRHVALQ